MKSILWSEEDQGTTFKYAEIPEDMTALCAEWRERMLETAAEANEEIMDKYLESDLSEEELKAAIRQLTLANEIVPVLCGSAFKNKGVRPCWTRYRPCAFAHGSEGYRGHAG